MHTEILVTGGDGLLGHALRKLLPDAVFLTRRDGDLTVWDETRRLFEEYKPKHVLHLAAEVGGVKKNAAQNADLFTTNVLINTHVLSAARQQGVERLISIVSSCVFHFQPGRPCTEEDLHTGLPFQGNLGYGYAKRMLDVQTRLLWEQYGCHFSTITPVTLYGPYDDWGLETGHVVSSLIHKCFLAKRENRPLEVWGNGRAVRQFVFAEDVARILLQALKSFEGPETVIVAPDSGITIAELAALVARVMKFEGSVTFNPQMPEGEPTKVIRSRRFLDCFPDFSFTQLEEGLRATAEWFSEHYQGLSPAGRTF